MPNFRLVNPVVLGSIETSYSSQSPSSAAKLAWSTLSKYMENSNPRFAFTLQNLSGGQLYHYVVKETEKKGKVDFSIDSLDLNVSSQQASSLIKNADKLYNQKGGEKDSSSSSSDSDTDSSVYEKVKRFKKKYGHTPISYWWYYPYVYNVDTTVSSVFVPTFNLPFSPIIEWSLSSAIVG
jgi:hypothetical protein